MKITSGENFYSFSYIEILSLESLTPNTLGICNGSHLA